MVEVVPRWRLEDKTESNIDTVLNKGKETVDEIEAVDKEVMNENRYWNKTGKRNMAVEVEWNCGMMVMMVMMMTWLIQWRLASIGSY